MAKTLTGNVMMIIINFDFLKIDKRYFPAI